MVISPDWADDLGWSNCYYCSLFKPRTPAVRLGKPTQSTAVGTTLENWTPETVPNGPDDVATFATSGITSIFLSEIEVSEIVFNPGASSFTITSDSFHLFTVSGLGIINNSGVTQQFIADQSLLTPETQPIQFTNSTTAGNGTVFQALGGIDEDGSGGGKIE